MPRGVYKRTEEHKRKISERQIGRKHPDITKSKISETLKRKGIKPPSFLGKKHSEKTKEKMSEIQKKIKPFLGKNHSIYAKVKLSKARNGEKNPNWNGGITPLRIKIWRSRRYQNWRRKVFERDGFTCQVCGDNRSGNLNAHHIKSFFEYPKRRFWVSNGITLCKRCHSLTDNYLRKVKEIEGKQINLFEAGLM